MKLLTVLTCLLQVLLAVPALAKEECTGQHRPLCTLKDVRESFDHMGLYVFQAYVVESFECPECPAGVFCEPCDDYVILSDQPDCMRTQCSNRFRLEVNDKNEMVKMKNGQKLEIRLGIVQSTLSVSTLKD